MVQLWLITITRILLKEVILNVVFIIHKPKLSYGVKVSGETVSSLEG